MKRWNIRPYITDQSDSTAAPNSSASLASQVTAIRGIDIKDGEISEPLLMADMEKAVEIIKSALYEGEKIAVFGDYDCDGVIGTVILCRYLAAQGGEPLRYIPSRDEGYGLNNDAVDSLFEKGVKLIITVDNGISCVEEADYIKEKGIKLIITDHHTVHELMPRADAIINPKRPDDASPFKELAGCGVVLKLIMALEGDIEGVLEQYADLAAVGTVGDVVPLLGENRIIVKHGLNVIPYTENIGLYKLFRQSGFSLEENDDRPTASSLSFTVCPRINAAGRFAHADKAAELLLTENEELADLRSAELLELNNHRRNVENEIMEQIDIMVAQNPALLSERVMVLVGKGWHHGVIGIVSTRVLSKWGKPNIILSDDGVNLRGSARSVDGFSLMPLLEHCSPYLERFGGHVKAAGLSAKSENADDIIREVKAYSKLHYPQMPFDVFYIDKSLVSADLSLENVESLASLMPFGEGNPIPLFLIQNCVILSKKPLKEGKFLSFNVRLEGGGVQKILHFTSTYSDFAFDVGQSVDVLVTLEINEYNSVRSVSARLKDCRPSRFEQERYFAALRAYESLKRGEEIDPSLACRALPEKSDIKIIYDILRLYSAIGNGGGNGVYIDRIYTEAAAKGLNYCKFRVVLDALSELGLIEHDIINKKLRLIPDAAKADLSNSRVLAEMRGLMEGKV
ncbi:MAG: single-stranded-DNA-specific exonuclease RecJ [Oscillospiraceae bacterium]|nr:single-stranded-DNA-specific exonuclease RecJ [Oscillospiraceae bacterium]